MGFSARFRPLSLGATLAALAAVTPALANWTATGTFMYMDRQFDQTGFTGVESPLPIRFADVEVVDANAAARKAVIATGATDANGFFSIPVIDSATRDVYVRAITRSNATPNLEVDVHTSASGQPVYYSGASGTFQSHPPTMNLDFGASVVGIGQGGEAFNIYDQMVHGVSYLVFLNGFAPSASQHLSAVWGLNNGIGDSYYSTGQIIFTRDSAGYDDTVILHEMGHYVVHTYSAVSNAGGAHTFSQCFEDLRLAFDEGWATYWGNSALRYAGFPRCNIYVRTNGGGGPGHLVRYADLETDNVYFCRGSTNELVVAMFLWDIADGTSTNDLTPGAEDLHDFMSADDREIWEVMTTQLPGQLNISLETFWDGWFDAPIQNGFHPEMMEVGDAVGVEYHEDTLEANGDPSSAVLVPTTGIALHATFFRDPEQDGTGEADQDYYSFFASAGLPYQLVTSGLFSHGDTFLTIYDSDGTTVLATNDNQAFGDDSSLIDWIAPHAGTYYARIVHGPSIGKYGSYDFTVQGPDSTPPGKESTTTPSGSGGADSTGDPERALPSKHNGQ